MNSQNLQNIPGPNTISQYKLQNGMTILSFSNHNSRSIYMVGIMKGGGVFDPQNKTGLAHFTASLLSRGTKDFTFTDFHNQIESNGANLVFSCSSQHAWFRGKSLAEDVELIFRLASDAIRNPSFKQEYVGRLRNQLLTGLSLRNQATSEMASILLDQNLFPNHPYGRPVDGYIDTIQPITRSDIINFHQEHYSPEDVVIVVSGAIHDDHIRDLAEKYFSSWLGQTPQQKNPIPIPPPPDRSIRKHIFLDDKSQVDLLLGSFGPFRTSQDYTPVYIGNNILGQFGLMGRIGKRVRSQSGLAYYATSSVSGWSDVGVWEFSAGVNPENTDKVIDLIRDEITRFIDSPVTDEELENTQSHLIGRMPMALESNAGLANAILTMHRFDLGLDYYQKYNQRVRSVTAEEILIASRAYLHPDRLVITSAGPGEEIE